MIEDFQGIKDKSPLVAWIHNISLNQQKYMKMKLERTISVILPV